MTRLPATAAVLGLAWLALVACATGGGTGSGGGKILVVAGQDVWGSIAAQLGGSRAAVKSIVTDPNADPHEYESSTDDARSFATARLVILNGAGYDVWAQRLLDASPSSERAVLVVAALLGKKAGDNPHFWYDPDYVLEVADRITAELTSIDPAGASYFLQRRTQFTAALQPYLRRLAEIRQRFAGTPVGATESICVYLAGYLGLDLVSPPELMQAVSEGSEPPAAAVARFQDQLAQRRVKVLVYNLQTATAVTTNLKLVAVQHGIPVVGVSEILQPLSSTFQDWQLRQLVSLENALAAGGAPR